MHAMMDVLMCFRVEWGFWTSSNDACGASCIRQDRFKLDFAETAITLEQVMICACAVYDRNMPMLLLGAALRLDPSYAAIVAQQHSISEQLALLCSKAIHNLSHTSWHDDV